MPSSVGVTSPSSVGFRSAVDPSGRNAVRGNDEQQAIGGSHFMIQPRGMHVTPSRPTEWRPGPDARSTGGYELSGIVWSNTEKTINVYLIYNRKRDSKWDCFLFRKSRSCTSSISRKWGLCSNPRLRIYFGGALKAMLCGRKM